MNWLKKLFQNKEGFILITSYLMLSTMFVFACSFFFRGHSFILTNERNQNTLVAFNMAEAGTDYAIAQLTESADDATASAEFTDLSSGNVRGGYAVTVSTPNVDINPTVRMIEAIGYAPDNDAASRAYAERRTTTYCQVQADTYFSHAVYAKNDITLHGSARNTIDSYNSSEGAYNAATASANGDIGTNGTSEGIIDINHNATVNGDVVVGPDADIETAVDAPEENISGEITSASTEKELDLQTTDLPSAGSISIAGRTTLTLPAGTYHYDSINISGQATLDLTGEVVIYVDGDIKISGQGISTASDLPTNLVIYSSGTSVQFTGNGDFYGGLYAPNADVHVTGNGTVYGAIVANSYLQTGNGSIHYDEAMEDTGLCSEATVRILAWKENHTANWTPEA